ncbi:hypothetical protein DFH09DRAFT_1203889 [Mycena vulgaris]|nr:hypothetical protein DFH09DRAFT_1203889 [Mycena vulgaris]
MRSGESYHRPSPPSFPDILHPSMSSSPRRPRLLVPLLRHPPVPQRLPRRHTHGIQKPRTKAKAANTRPRQLIIKPHTYARRYAPLLPLADAPFSRHLLRLVPRPRAADVHAPAHAGICPRCFRRPDVRPRPDRRCRRAWLLRTHAARSRWPSTR